MSQDDPEIQWALDLLTYKPEFRTSFLHRNQIVLGVTAAFASAQPLYNLMRKIPVYHQFHKTILLTVVGCGLGVGIKEIKKSREAKVDYDMKQYVLRHPELFRRQPIKWADVFETWAPYR